MWAVCKISVRRIKDNPLIKCRNNSTRFICHFEMSKSKLLDRPKIGYYYSNIDYVLFREKITMSTKS